MDKKNIAPETLANHIQVSSLTEEDLKMFIEVFVKYWEGK
jgi:hypothetical protein